jgi:AmmeMemoRadiSam system protein A
MHNRRMMMATYSYVKLAREAIHYYLFKKKLLACPSPLPSNMSSRSGVFVSIKIKKNNNLRGCIGTIEPNQDNLAKEIIKNAVRAATCDPRFEPVKIDELDKLSFSVDILTPLELIDSPDELNPKQYGLSINSNDKQGILLPDLKGIDTPEQQIDICLKKANISKSLHYQMYRFEVKRYN